ncbi:3-ketoacyl-CoA synthase 4-like [Silene latifolia]|uniref:3-ketoacyl-CoA synthase 4-like n=1 Tax=Silene latifolia TaxID=37657 RepID=UPI003D787B2B
MKMKIHISLTYTHIFLQSSLLLLFFLSQLPPFSIGLSLAFVGAFSIIFLYLVYYLFFKPYPILLLDYSCYKPPDDRKSNVEFDEYFVRRTQRFNEKSIDFMRSIYLKSGLGEETYVPPFVFDGYDEAPYNYVMLEAREGMFSAVDSVLLKAKIDPRDIHIVIVTCGGFSPAPSLSSLLVHRYGMDPSVRTFNLGGMGCGSGVLSIDMASHLLRASGRKVQNALVVITENISLNWYLGDNRPMLVTNVLFRVGCAATIITNDPARARLAKFQLMDSLRTHHGADDSSYRAAIQEEDDKGTTGISLTKDLIRVAGQNLRAHLRILAPRVLPLSQLIQYAKSVTKSVLTQGESKPIVPDFTTAFDHICIHTGGKAVIEAVGKALRLGDSITEPARMTLHRFGNTSSSLVFYELAYFEAKEKIKKGDKLWMLAFGTGFKVGSLVWKALVDSSFDENPWNDCINRYPLKAW